MAEPAIPVLINYIGLFITLDPKWLPSIVRSYSQWSKWLKISGGMPKFS